MKKSKRLTIRNIDGTVSQPFGVSVEDVFYRLADYEDLGLLPEEIQELEKCKESKIAVNEQEENAILKAAIKEFGKDAQIDMAIEEMSELIKALLKERRKRNERTLKPAECKDLLSDICEEIADVEIMLDQLKMIFTCDLFVDVERKKKIERLKKNIEIRMTIRKEVEEDAKSRSEH